MSTFIQKYFPKIHEINQRYAKPRVKLSKPMRIILFLLRCYLVLLVGLLVFKFVTTVTG
jgi:hypothetical protein